MLRKQNERLLEQNNVLHQQNDALLQQDNALPADGGNADIMKISIQAQALV